jgi:hypothetical protein
MNERILELANEANKNIGYTFKLEDANQLHELMEKFAELIVRECAEVADNADATREKWEGIGKYVREHFGVE